MSGSDIVVAAVSGVAAAVLTALVAVWIARKESADRRFGMQVEIQQRGRVSNRPRQRNACQDLRRRLDGFDQVVFILVEPSMSQGTTRDHYARGLESQRIDRELLSTAERLGVHQDALNYVSAAISARDEFLNAWASDVTPLRSEDVAVARSKAVIALQREIEILPDP